MKRRPTRVVATPQSHIQRNPGNEKRAMLAELVEIIGHCPHLSHTPRGKDCRWWWIDARLCKACAVRLLPTADWERCRMCHTFAPFGVRMRATNSVLCRPCLRKVTKR